MIEKQKTYFGLSPIKRSGEIADKKHRKKEISRSLKKPKFFEKNLKFLETLKKELKKKDLEKWNVRNGISPKEEFMW
ncbi:MAG: hypothetical protein ABIJ80_01840 [Patescibacteria group bacterium]